MSTAIRLGWFCFFLFMALRKSQRIRNLACSVVFDNSMASRIANASAEKIEHVFGSLYVMFVFSNMNVIPTPSYDLEASVYIF